MKFSISEIDSDNISVMLGSHCVTFQLFSCNITINVRSTRIPAIAKDCTFVDAVDSGVSFLLGLNETDTWWR